MGPLRVPKFESGLLTIGMRYLPAAEAGLIWILESILTPVWVWVVLGEQPSPMILLGGGLVLSAVVTQSVYTLRAHHNNGNNDGQTGFSQTRT